MRDEPSVDLIKKLAASGLATREDLLNARRHARRLARDLPLFDSVWVDALVQAHKLTPYQATEINAGRARQLRVGPYIVREVVSHWSCGTCYVARPVHGSQDVWLVVLHPLQNDRDSIAERLAKLCKQMAHLDAGAIVPFDGAGVADGTRDETGSERAWVTCRVTPGVSAAAWMVPEGRFPPEAVLEIARQMATALAAIELLEMVHGDLCARGLFLQHEGLVRLLVPGLRAIVRPREGFAHTDSHAEAFDYLAPERIDDGAGPDSGTGPTVASDLYACGLLWWHLLTGRPPLAGGNALAKLEAAQAAKITDVRRLAPETPAVLAEAIRRCTQRDAADRPTSFSDLAELLGPATEEGRMTLIGCLTSQAPLRSRLAATAITARHSRHAPVWSAALAGCLLVVAAILWPRWRNKIEAPLAHIGLVKTEKPNAGEDAAENDTNEPLKNEAVADALDHGKPRLPESNELILPTDEAVHLDVARLKPGQTVRGADGQRARIIAPASGLIVAVDGVRFENIDFVASIFPSRPSGQEASVAGDAAPVRTIVSLRSGNVTFEGCSFQPEPAAAAQCVAIAWHGTADNRLDRLPEAGRLRLVDCTLHEVDAGVDVGRSGPLQIEADNVLHLGPGPLVRLHHAVGLEGSISLQLLRCTLRDATALLEWHYDSLPEQPGNVFVEASDCAFALRNEGALVMLRGPTRPEELLRSLIWTGQGSLLSVPARFAAWLDGAGTSHPVDDALATVDGLVMSHVQFAGATSGGATNSRLVDWSAPLRGDRPPGISPSPLVLPRLH